MNINYSWTKDFSTENLEKLFLSVGWESGNHPEKLRKALFNSHRVYSAWDGCTLVGLINSMTDTALTAYFQYLLVKPEYQGTGIGKTLTKDMLDIYADIPRKILISMEDKVDFYTGCGFVQQKDKAPMFLSSL